MGNTDSTSNSRHNRRPTRPIGPMPSSASNPSSSLSGSTTTQSNSNSSLAPSIQPNNTNNNNISTLSPPHPSSNPGAYSMNGSSARCRFYVTIPPGISPGQTFPVRYGEGPPMTVRCPEGSFPGDRLIVSVPRPTQQYIVRVPANIGEGQQFRVQINNEQVMVTCPQGVKPGERVTFMLPQSLPGASGASSTGTGRSGGSSPNPTTYHQPTLPRIDNNSNANYNNSSSSSSSSSSSNISNLSLPPPFNPSNSSSNNTSSTPNPSSTLPPPINQQMFEVEVPAGVKPNEPFALLANNQKVIVRCPPNVRPGQKIRFHLPEKLSEAQLGAYKLVYDKDGWTRCLTENLKFQWVYSLGTYHNDEGNGSSKNKDSFDHIGNAYVREFVNSPFSPRKELQCASAESYLLDPNTANIPYYEITRAATLPFEEKLNWFRQKMSIIRIPWEQGHIKIKIRRASILLDSMDAIESITTPEMKKIFRYEFLGEPGLDAGGVSREFYNTVAEKIFQPDNGLFLYSSINQMCMQINPNSGIANEDHLRYFHMTGRILAKSLMDGYITPIRLIPLIYKHILAWPVTLKDIEYIDNDLYEQLAGLYKFKDSIEDLGLDFTVTEDQLGNHVEVELIKNGAQTTVNSENLDEYLRVQTHYRTLLKFKDQLAALVSGFYDVIPEAFLSVFNFQELELALHGLPNIDMEDWIRNTEYMGIFQTNKDHQVVKWFWEVVSSFSHEQKAKLLQFVTGSSGVPSQGFSYLQGNDGAIRPFTLHGDPTIYPLPRAHTCFNRIDLPIYTSKEDMDKFLNIAINLEMSFGIE